MMRASQISARIRAKKKAMSDEAVKLSGIPEDATDIDYIKRQEAGERLSTNEPPDRNEDPSLDSEIAQETAAEPHRDTTEMARDGSTMASGGEEDDAKMKRRARLRQTMAKMK